MELMAGTQGQLGMGDLSFLSAAEDHPLPQRSMPRWTKEMPLRSIDRHVRACRSMPAVQKNQHQILSTEEPRDVLGQEPSYFYLLPELILGHRTTYTNTAWRELGSKECLHTSKQR